MSRPEFEMIVASAPREKLVTFYQLNNGVLNAGLTETTRFYAPANMIVKVVALGFSVQAVPGATSGKHYLFASYENPALDVINGVSNFGGVLELNHNTFLAADYLKSPSTDEAVVTAIVNLTFDSVTPLKIQYQNITNANQTASRTLTVWGVARQVGG
jgi:hypothetical protein